MAEPTEAELQQAVDSMIACIPSPPDGCVRLWRIEGSLPGAPRPGWMAFAMASMGILEARGRWFTDRADFLGWYASDQWPGQPQLACVTVPEHQAETWRVGRSKEVIHGKTPQMFSADPDNEFFLPRAVADRRQVVGLVADALAMSPAPVMGF
jgi:hypothetical protein